MAYQRSIPTTSRPLWHWRTYTVIGLPQAASALVHAMVAARYFVSPPKAGTFAPVSGIAAVLPFLCKLAQRTVYSGLFPVSRTAPTSSKTSLPSEILNWSSGSTFENHASAILFRRLIRHSVIQSAARGSLYSPVSTSARIRHR